MDRHIYTQIDRQIDGQKGRKQRQTERQRARLTKTNKRDNKIVRQRRGDREIENIQNVKQIGKKIDREIDGSMKARSIEYPRPQIYLFSEGHKFRPRLQM